MEILQLSESGIGPAAQKAASVIFAGGVVLFPTDTLYALGADALSDDAVAKIYAIKGRDEKKPMHCIVKDINMVEEYAEIDDAARMLTDDFLPGPLTLVLKKHPETQSGIARGISTFGFRIPKSDLCMEIVRIFGGPITATSANTAGSATERSVGKILEQLGEEAARIDLIIDAGELPESLPSTVVDLTGERPEIIREGAIVSDDIWDALFIDE
ncbi:threonylcarbamoyl-AMP synthase [Candidatus Kaiserbacteria bacterium]|nr:threonylcarbamoyl-AMP synthase [Candidatus Kaiserbacteria bacterium]